MNKKQITSFYFIYTVIGCFSFGFCQTTSLVVKSVLPTSVCAGSNIVVAIESNEIFESNNLYTVQLSNVDGSFSNPISLGTVKILGNITCTIPALLVAGNNYKIRAVATHPALVSNEYISSITITAKPPLNVKVKGLTAVPWNKNIFYLTDQDSIQYSSSNSNEITQWTFGNDALPSKFTGTKPPFVKYKTSGNKVTIIENVIGDCKTTDTLGTDNLEVKVFNCIPTLPPKALLIADSNRTFIENVGAITHFVLCRDALLSKAKAIGKVSLYLEEGSNFYMKGSTNQTTIYNTENASATLVAGPTSKYSKSVIVKSKISSLTFSPISLKDSFALLTCPKVAVDYFTNYRCLVGNLCDTFDENYVRIDGKDTVCIGESVDYKITLSGEKTRWQTSDAGNITSQSEQKATVNWLKPGLTTINIYIQLKFCDSEFISKKSVYVRNLSEGGCITGIRKQENDLQIYLTPNPVSEFLNVNTTLYILQIQFVNLMGKVCKTITDDYSRINMSDLENGCYIAIIQLRSGEKKFHKIEKL